MPVLKKSSNPYSTLLSKIKSEQAENDTTEFQLRLQQFYGGGGAGHQNMESLPIGLTGDTGFYNPLKNHPVILRF